MTHLTINNPPPTGTFTAWRNLTIIGQGPLPQVRGLIEAAMNQPSFRNGTTRQVMVTDETNTTLFRAQATNVPTNTIFTVEETP